MNHRPSPASARRSPSRTSDVAPLAVRALVRAAELGIDPYRVALALAIPLDDVAGLIADGSRTDGSRSETRAHAGTPPTER